MLGRDPITFDFERDGEPQSVTVYGTVLTEQLDGKLEPFGGSLLFKNYFRLILPRTFDIMPARCITVSFADRTGEQLEKPIVAVFDGRGRVHHFECVVRSR